MKNLIAFKYSLPLSCFKRSLVLAVMGISALYLLCAGALQAQDSTFSLNGTSAYYNGGNVGIGTSTPANKLTINSSGYGLEHTNGTIRLATSMSNAAGFGTLTNHGLYFFVNNSPAISIDTGGAVSMTTISHKGTVTVGTPNAETGLTFLRQNGSYRADIRFDGTTLKLVEGFGGGPPSSTAGLAIDGSGNVGIGTITPGGKLDIAAQDAVRLIGYQPFLTIYDTSNSNARGRVASVAGDVDLFTESYLSGANTSSFLKVGNNGNVGVGTVSPAAKLDVNGTTRTKVLTITGGADIAEPFQMNEEELEKGSVVVIDEARPGRLKRSMAPYDKRVAGVISGANGIHPGIALQQEGEVEGGQNVALSGRVYVRADASHGAIEPGDMLTTSDTPGCAMKVSDPRKAQGAVLGKAMTPLGKGQGMVLVLVTLQ